MPLGFWSFLKKRSESNAIAPHTALCYVRKLSRTTLRLLLLRAVVACAFVNCLFAEPLVAHAA